HTRLVSDWSSDVCSSDLRVGAPLSDEEVRRVASYQQSFNEMARGERFVEDVLRAKARRRERWIVGLPAAGLALVGLGLLARVRRLEEGRVGERGCCGGSA